MAKDTKKNSAYDSGLRGKEKPGRRTEPTLAEGATEVSVRRADNGYIVSCSYPPKKGKDYFYSPPVQHVFQSASEVATFIEEELGAKDKDDKK